MLSNRTQFYLEMLSVRPGLSASAGEPGSAKPMPAPGVVDTRQSILTGIGLISKHSRLGAMLLQAVYLNEFNGGLLNKMGTWLRSQPQMFDIGPKLLQLEKAKASPYVFGETFRERLSGLLLSEVNHLMGSHSCGYCKGRGGDCERCEGVRIVPNKVFGERKRVELLGMVEDGITRHFWRTHLQAEYDAILSSVLAELSHASVLLHHTIDGFGSDRALSPDTDWPEPSSVYNRWPNKQWYSGSADAGG